MVEAPPWDSSSSEFSRQEQSMFNYRGWFFIPPTPVRWQLFINSVTSYVYDATDVMDDDNFATVLESFVNILSLQVTQVNSKEALALDHLGFTKKWDISPKKELNMMPCITHCGVYTVANNSYLDVLGLIVSNCSTESYYIMCIVIHCLLLQCLGKAINVHRFLPLIFGGLSCSQQS